MNHLKTFEKFSKNEVQYDKSELDRPNKADLDKNKKINPYEKKRGKSIEKSMKRKKIS
jgi:hypothetical protein